MKNKKMMISLLSVAAVGTVATIACTPLIVKRIKQNIRFQASKTQYVSFIGKSSDVTIIGPKYVQTKVGKCFGTIKAPTAYKDQRPNAYWLYADNYGSHSAGTKVELDDVIIDQELRVYPYFDNDVDITKCMGISAFEDSLVSVIFHGYEANNIQIPKIEYSKDGLSWQTLPTTAQTIPAGKTYYFRGENLEGISKSKTIYTSLSIGGAVNLNGNIMTLIDNGKGETNEIPNDYCFYRLFENCAGIKSISSKFLCATHLKAHCYESMFSSCNYLTTFPSQMLPADDLSDAPYCYSRMFEDCRKIKTIPVGLLEAHKLGEGCYYAMFNRCTALTTIPANTLPSTTLAPNCYQGMFFKCKGLTNIDVDLLPATNLKYACYADMFAECEGLTTLPGTETKHLLPATDLTGATACYYDMFYNCTNLVNVPTNFLPATKLGPNCYMAMFYNCSSLATSPKLDVTNLTGAPGCYEYMFGGSGITTLPELPATTLSSSCYKGMFVYCNSLVSIVDSISSGHTSYLPATTLAANCYDSMFKGCEELTTATNQDGTKSVLPSDEITITDYACYKMFFMCSNLSASPDITVAAYGVDNKTAPYCFSNMFYRCTNLIKIGKLEFIESGGGWTTDYSHVIGDKICELMFAECSRIEFSTQSSSGFTSFFSKPNYDSTANEPFNYMLQLGWADEGKTPSVVNPGNSNYYKAH